MKRENVEKDKLDFGDFVTIEQLNYGFENKHYIYKVINRRVSSRWVDVPVQSPETNKKHKEREEVVCCICCGFSETDVHKYRVVDVAVTEKP